MNVAVFTTWGRQSSAIFTAGGTFAQWRDGEHFIVADQHGGAEEGNQLRPSPQVGCLQLLDNVTQVKSETYFIHTEPN